MQELTRDEIDELLRAQVVGRIGCHADGRTYVVPIIYAYADGCAYVLTTEGQKVQMMRANPQVCFEVDEYDGRGSWRSVIAQGRYEELDGADARRALELLVDRFRARREAGDAPAERPQRGEGRETIAFRIRLEEPTGRAVRR